MTTAPAATRRPPATGPVDGRWPRRAFVAGLVVAAPLLLWFGRDHWFFLDEWWVLRRPGLTDPGYLDPHNGHWITLVVLDYRLNFRLWGLGTYLPYQVPVVAAHLGSAALLRIVMLRVGVRGWLATGAALVFVFLGTGRDNITFGFQLSMTGSLLAGLALLLVAAGRDGPFDRRDLGGLAIGVAGLMTSSVFVGLLVGVGVAVLVRRGARVAAAYAVPLGLVYGAWYVAYGAGEGDPLRLTGATVRFAARMLGAVLSAVTAGGVAGAVLGAVAAVGVGAAVHGALRSGDRRAAALLVGPVVGWAAFAGLTALARAEVPATADSHGTSRYVHVGAALLLPAVAAGVEHLTRWRTAAGAAAALLLVAGVPRNLDRLSETDPLFRSGIDLFGEGSEEIVRAAAHSPYVSVVPGDHVMATIEPRLGMTAGWLARHGADGRIPPPDDPSRAVELTADSLLVLARSSPGGTASCGPVAPGRQVALAAGDEIRFAGLVQVTLTDGGARARPRLFTSSAPAAVRALAGPVDVVVTGGATAACRG